MAAQPIRDGVTNLVIRTSLLAASGPVLGISYVERLIEGMLEPTVERAASVTQQTDPEISICNDKTLPLSRQPDGQGFYIHCIGGFRAAMSENDLWAIEPVLDNGRPCRKGFVAKAELDVLMRRTGLMPIAFQSLGWRGGDYHSNWSPLIPGRTNHLQGPSDLWINVASNLAPQRSGAELRDMTVPTHEKIATILDDRTEEERLALSISLSLRSMDISVEQIAEFYNEQLVNLMAAGLVDGQRSGGTQDQTLFAHVHSFFLHLGAARDYLAALIAARIGKDPRKVDSMADLICALRPRHFGTDALLDLLETRKFIQPIPENPNKRKMSGWLREASDLRNQFVHRRPYGARHLERFGYVTAIAPEMGLYRYMRPILVEKDAERDVLDVVVRHYKQATALFQDMAEASGWDISMLTLTDKDIISIKRSTR